jgi:hypothetical protein
MLHGRRRVLFGLVVAGVQGVAVALVQVVWRLTKAHWSQEAWAFYLAGMVLVIPAVGLSLAQTWTGARLRTSAFVIAVVFVALINSIVVFGAMGGEEAGIAFSSLVSIYLIILIVLALVVGALAGNILPRKKSI